MTNQNSNITNHNSNNLPSQFTSKKIQNKTKMTNQNSTIQSPNNPNPSIKKQKKTNIKKNKNSKI